MPRPLRSTFPYGYWHITSRGVDKRMIFVDAEDRRVFLRLFDRVIRELGWRCHAYCLMGNHYHLVIECGQPELSKGMQLLNGLYAAYFNHRQGRVGHLFQGRFASRPIDDESDLARTCQYVIDNPVRAGLTRRAEDWPWGGLGRPLSAPSRTAARPRAARRSSPVRRPRSPDASAPATQ